tara:strand:- start:350 stop:505 length:156 start_codon:yes stop_codon:yes gene_type:complete
MYGWNPETDYWALNAGYRVAEGDLETAERGARRPLTAQTSEKPACSGGLLP